MKKESDYMELSDIKSYSFPKPSLENWKEAVETSLKGKKIERLTTRTYEEIELQPLYFAPLLTNNKTVEWPGIYPFTRGIYPIGYQEKPWLICQPVSGNSANEANKNMQSALARGQNVIMYPSYLLATEADIIALFQDLPILKLPIFIDAKGRQKDFLHVMKQIGREKTVTLTGAAVEDPIAEWARIGKLPKDPDEYLAEWILAIQEYDQEYPQLKTMLVNTAIYHNSGATAVQELAIGLSTAVYYLLAAQKQGLTVEEITDKLIFSFAVDSHYFMSIAKLRAARRLWAGLSEAFQAKSESFKMHIHAVTSERTESGYDQYVNILRTANQAFAAAIGGIQYLQIHPFDHVTGHSDDFSERIARNTHLILNEETHITKVIDPAGGSFYVEQLTDELAEKAWSKFLEIEEAGGIIAALKSGIIQKEISLVFYNRQENISLRKESVIGTNVYPNPSDRVAFLKSTSDPSFMTLNHPVKIESVKPNRATALFEEIRMKSEGYREKSGRLPKIGLINWGDLKSYRPRADFVKNLLVTGGIEVIESKSCYMAEDATTFIALTNIPVYCICGTDQDYTDYAKQVVTNIREFSPDTTIYLVGQQSEKQTDVLLKAGLKDVVHAKTNAADFLTEVHKKLGVK
jgi:methylmalonyl-CoA mutase